MGVVPRETCKTSNRQACLPSGGDAKEHKIFTAEIAENEKKGNKFYKFFSVSFLPRKAGCVLCGKFFMCFNFSFASFAVKNLLPFKIHHKHRNIRRRNAANARRLSERFRFYF